jgi:hypothetical protein
MRDNGKTGLHIHISTNQFLDDDHISRFMYFNSFNATQRQCFSRRRRPYDSFNLTAIYANSLHIKSFSPKRGYDWKCQGGIVRGHTDFNTIEVRMFLGMPSYQWIMTCIEFYKSLMDFTKKERPYQKEYYQWNDFVSISSKEYKYLDHYLNSSRMKKCVSLSD